MRERLQAEIDRVAAIETAWKAAAKASKKRKDGRDWSYGLRAVDASLASARAVLEGADLLDPIAVNAAMRDLAGYTSEDDA